MKTLRFLLTTLFLSASLSISFGAAFHTGQTSASYTGQGQTGVTFFDNAGLVVQNPAAMTKLNHGMHFYGGFTRYSTTFSYSDLDGGNSTETSHPAAVAPQGYALYNGGDWAVGSGLYLPFNSGLEWGKTWTGRDVLGKLSLKTLNQPVVGSYSFRDMSVGGGLNFIAASVRLERIADKSTETPVVIGATGQTTGWNSAFLYDGGNISGGFVYNSAFTISGTGNANFDTSSAPALTDTFADGGVKADLKYPSTLEIAGSYKSFTSGDGYQPGAFAVEFGILQSSWSVYDEIVIKFDKKKPSEESKIVNNWKDVMDWKIGGFYSLSESMKLRGGFYKAASPIEPQYLGPTTPDGNGKNSIFLGFGFKADALLLDAAYINSTTLPSETSSSPENGLAGKYSGSATVLQFGIGYSF